MRSCRHGPIWRCNRRIRIHDAFADLRRGQPSRNLVEVGTYVSSGRRMAARAVGAEDRFTSLAISWNVAGGSHQPERPHMGEQLPHLARIEGKRGHRRAWHTFRYGGHNSLVRTAMLERAGIQRRACRRACAVDAMTVGALAAKQQRAFACRVDNYGRIATVLRSQSCTKSNVSDKRPGRHGCTIYHNAAAGVV